MQRRHQPGQGERLGSIPVTVVSVYLLIHDRSGYAFFFLLRFAFRAFSKGSLCLRYSCILSYRAFSTIVDFTSILP